MSFKKSLPIASADIEKFSHDGRGIARINGKITFIDGALPGEKLVFQYTKIKKDFDEGRVISVDSASDLRVSPSCLHYSICGGCSLQHVSQEAQIKLKEEALLDLLRQIAKVRPEKILPALTSDTWNYRSKARLSVRYVEKKGKTLIGFREKNNPSYVADISHCPILSAKVADLLPSLCALIDSLDNPRVIAQIELAAGDTAQALIFRNLASLSIEDKDKLSLFGKTHDFMLFLQSGSIESIELLYPQSETAQADSLLHYALPEENISFAFHPSDFTQINPSLNRKMVQRAIELLDLKADDVVLDLFCGLGNFSLPIARRVKTVIGIEGSAAMVDRARYNAKINQSLNTQFYAINLDSSSAWQTLRESIQPTDLKFTKVLIDPPRTGAYEIVKQIDVLNLERIVYVACNPATLARDTDILVNVHGFCLKAVGVMDMFPHTMHVESIAVFE